MILSVSPTESTNNGEYWTLKSFKMTRNDVLTNLKFYLSSKFAILIQIF